ncbi:hypothetical protein NUACC21_69070 [Scytonema sp. NUACC21]
MEPIAIIGTGCRFPGGHNPESFWYALREGRDLITKVPLERWNVDAFYDPEPAKPAKVSSQWGSFIENVDQFDAEFFEILPEEAKQIDPQQRLLLEVAWEALENAALRWDKVCGSQTGVFIGNTYSDYDRLIHRNLTKLNAHSGTGINRSLLANRLSHLLDLHGPSMTVDTACSASLVAVHLACQSLRTQESNLALAGGVHLNLCPESTMIMSSAKMLAADGRCKTFDAKANGFSRGEGCGVVVLKRLSDALGDGDNILAIIRGSAVNHNGLSNGISAPHGLSQQAVISQALDNAQIEPAQISYVEVHSTGTVFGDAIEVESLKQVLMQGRSLDQPCWIGSVKTNIGHLEGAAGIAGLIKVILSLQHQEIPPHLHLNQRSRYIPLEGTSLNIPTHCQPWSTGTEPRVAGVSAFSFGGANCHVILEQAPAPSVLINNIERPLHILTLSAKNDKAVHELALRYIQTLPTESELANVCFTANTGRAHFHHRLAVVAPSTKQLKQALSDFLDGKQPAGLISGIVNNRKRSKIAFLFSHEGSHHVGMGYQLYQTHPIFQQTLNECEDILRSYLHKPLLSVLYPQADEISPLNEITYAHPALFALEYALFQLWQSWGVKPNVLIGYGIGEYAAACAAGVFNLEDGLKLIAERALVVQSLQQKEKMLAGLADEKDMNSQQIKPAMERFQQVVASVTYAKPQIDLISGFTGERLTEKGITPEYWWNHLHSVVALTDSFKTVNASDNMVFVEIGPKPILIKMAEQCLPEKVGVWLPSLNQSQQDWQQILQSLGELYIRGVPIDWSEFDRGYNRQRLSLPTYPWQRQRYWISEAEEGHQRAEALSPENTQTPITNLLNEGNAQQLAQLMQKAGNFSQEQMKLLPEMLAVLVREHQQHLKDSQGELL